jgi:Gamma-glutamyl phosphate reductase
MSNNIFEYVKIINQKSKNAFDKISKSSSKDRNLAILNTSLIIKQKQEEILQANKIDIGNAKKKNLTDAFVDRLFINDKRINDIINGLNKIAEMDDPIGIELSRWKQPNGLDISRISVPLGIIGIIYESRPNVTIDAGSLCIKSGNTVILRGGSDS